MEIVKKGEELGSGAYGTVYLANILIDGKLFEDIVIKEIKLGKKVTKESIEKEIEMLKRVQNSEHTVKYYAAVFDEISQTFKIAMERLEEIDLYEDVSIEQKFDISRQLLSGLAFIHSKSVVHSDLKPANIMIRPGTGKLVFTDFGLSCVHNSSEFECRAAGSPAYMHPVIYFTLKKKYELVGNKKHRTNFITDIYSLGTILYTVFMGEKYLEFDFLTPMKMSDYKDHFQFQMECFMEEGYDKYPHLNMVMREMLNPIGRKRSAEELLEELNMEAI